MVREIQDALLPKSLPVVPGLDVSARYLLAEDGTSAGGDWFDAVVRPDGAVALVVGDVVGHGVEASAAMGQQRAVLRHSLRSSTLDLVQVLSELDRFARSEPAAMGTTVSLVEVQPRVGRVRHVSAGHPPPLVVGADGGARFLPATGSRPIGLTGPTGPTGPTGSTGSTERRGPVDEHQLERDDAVLLYTDGLLERPGTSPAAATVDLARVAGNAMQRSDLLLDDDRATERLCELTLELLTRTTGHTDDVTLLAAQVVDPVGPLTMVFPARPDSVRKVRLAAAVWLTDLGVASANFLAVQHALGELTANVVDHAYQGPETDAPDALSVECDVDDNGVAVVRVSDRGRCRDNPDQPRVSTTHDEVVRGERGRGLAMVAALADDVQIERTPTGTQVTTRFRLGRPAVMLTNRSAKSTPRRVGDADLTTMVDQIDPQSPPTIRVSGPVDSVNTGLLRAVLEHVTTGGTMPALLDLTDVTHLGSQGVQLLFEHTDLELVAPLGSVAQHVLDLVELPYRAP